MDYRNADGSVAEYVRQRRARRRPLPGSTAVWTSAKGEFQAALWLTRGRHPGWCRSRATHASVHVDMGRAKVGETNSTPREPIDGSPTRSPASPSTSATHTWPASADAKKGGDRRRSTSPAPPAGHDPSLFPHGVNVGVLVSPIVGEEIEMRVHERGVGETRSAAAAARSPRRWRPWGTPARPAARSPCAYPGAGRGHRHRTTSYLHGPSVLVARGELSEQWWQERVR